ncbi:hypothetical protein ES703_38385 [subsurface metagenome]
MAVLGLVAGGIGAGLTGAGAQMGRDKPEETLEYAREQKPFMRAAQAQIPLYLQVMSGGMPDFLKRYLMQTQGALQQQTGMNIQDYLRQVGGRGMDFGPSVAAGMSNIYGAQIPALAQGLTQTRGSILERGMGAMQQWSAMTPQKMRRVEQPSVGRAALSGVLSGVGRGMGQLSTQEMKGRKPLPLAGQAGGGGEMPPPKARAGTVPTGAQTPYTMGGGRLLRR